MAEQRFTNTSVNLKAKRRSQSEVKRMEDNMYEEMDMKNKGTKQTSDTNDKRCACITFCTSVIACWAILLLIMALRIYCTTWLIHKNEDLMTSQLNLTEACTAFEMQIRDLTAENQNLTEQIKHTKKELSLCPERPCKTCQEGWLPFESSCYAINDAEEPQQKTWEEARENCKGKMSDLAVVINAAEKKYISDKSWKSSGEKGYWIGLRGEGGRWKWVDGSYLTDNSWIQHPPSNGLCVISVQNEGFKSVSCDKKKQWICKKKL